MHAIFFSKNGLLRSGWRAVFFLCAFVLTAVTLGGAAHAALYSAGIDAHPGSSVFLITNALPSLILAIVFGWLAGRIFEHLPFRALGVSFTKGWFKHLVVGMVIGSLTLGIAVLITWIGGGLRFELDAVGRHAILASMGSSLLVFGLAAAFEEALFRGYVLQTFARSGLAWLAILLTSVFFGAVHLGNPNSTYLATINTILAGLWFSVAYLKTRDLWFVWGMHLMWNWVQGSIFGVEVSGIKEVSLSPLLKEIDLGPAWLTGGDYGLEAGIACTVALLISTVAIYFMPGVEPDKELLRLNLPPGDTERVGLP